MEFEWTSFQNVWRYHIQLKSLSFKKFMRRNSCIDSFWTLSPESSTESDSQSYEQSQKSCGQKHLKLRKSGVKKDIYKKLNLGRYIPVELRDFQSRSAFSFCRHLSIYSSAGKKDFPPKRTEWTRFSVISWDMYLSKYGRWTNPTEAWPWCVDCDVQVRITQLTVPHLWTLSETILLGNLIYMIWLQRKTRWNNSKVGSQMH